MIVEYCCNGNLLNYLRSKRNDQSSPLTARHCVDMAAQVATGMEFLASKDVRRYRPYYDLSDAVRMCVWLC